MLIPRFTVCETFFLNKKPKIQAQNQVTNHNDLNLVTLSQPFNDDIHLFPHTSKFLPSIDAFTLQFFFNPKQLVVFRKALAPAWRTGLDLTCLKSHYKIGDENVLCLTGTVGNLCLTKILDFVET